MKRLLIIFCVAITMSCISSSQKMDSGFTTTLLGNPYAAVYQSGDSIYARNIWDMQLYDGKIYLGAGNSSNVGPVPNAGRVPLYFLDPKKETFTNEYKVAEEQVDRFKVFNKKIYIPGHDATQVWDFGNFYRYKSNKWHKIRTIPVALHVYDLLIYNKKIVAGGSIKTFGSVFISDDDGQTWTTHTLDRGRVYTVFSLGDNLFSMMKYNLKRPNWGGLFKWSEENAGFEKLHKYAADDIFPETELKAEDIKIVKQLVVGKSLFYLGAYSHNDHQGIPFGLYKMDLVSGELVVYKIRLSEEYTPRDLISRKHGVYLLSSKKVENSFISTVHKIDPLKEEQTEIIGSFSYPTFARSFEKYKDNFYFGMGCEIKDPKNWDLSELNNHTGDIVKRRFKKIVSH